MGPGKAVLKRDKKSKPRDTVSLGDVESWKFLKDWAEKQMASALGET